MHEKVSIARDRTAGRRWALLLPVAFVTYSLAYVDRANYSIGSAGGLGKDLGITGEQDALLGALFFLGYFLFQIPGAWYAASRSAKRLIFFSLLLWGALASLTGLLPEIHLLYLDRFALGIAESVVLPGMLVFLSHWFTRAERSRANAILILGNPVTVLWMSVISGYLVHGIGWRGMFVAEGVPAILWAFVWWRLVADKPAQASWLRPRESAALEERLAKEQRTLAPMRNYAEAFRSPFVIVLSIQYFCWSIGVYGFVLWLPSMLRSSSTIGIVEVGWLSAAPYLLATLLMIVASSLSDKLGQRRIFVWPFLVVGAVAFLGSYWIGRASFWPGFACLVVAGGAMYAPYGPFFAWIPEVLPRNVAGGAIAMINSCGALGSFVGSYAVGWLNAATGGPSLSYLAMALALLASGLLTLIVRDQVPRRSEEATQPAFAVGTVPEQITPSSRHAGNARL